VPWISWKYNVDIYYLYLTNGYTGEDVWGTNIQGGEWGRAAFDYPGKDAEFPAHDKGIAGPLPSIRMKIWRRGAQDYEYFVLAQRAGINTATNVDYIVQASLDGDKSYSPAGWKQNGYSYERQRGNLANLLEGQSPPDPPPIINPVNGAVNQSLSPVIQWNSQVGATSYRLEIAEDSLFQSTRLDSTSSLTSVTAGPLKAQTKYFMRLQAKNNLGAGPFGPPTDFSTGDETAKTSVDQTAIVTRDYQLKQNYPNPFNPTTTIEFSLAQPGQTSLKVYNSLGAEIHTLVSGLVDAGTHRVVWDASKWASGVYVYQLRSGSYVNTQRLVYLK
jgi:hypothetical protein